MYNLEPIGIGTPFVEGLTSYLMRISSAHCITTGDFIKGILLPILKKKLYYSGIYAQNYVQNFHDGACLLGNTQTASMNIDILNNLTSRSDLKHLTLVPHGVWLDTKGSIKQNKYWCGYCLEDMRINNSNIYEMLIWNICHVNCCTIHKTELHHTCPFCNSFQKFIKFKSTIGYCQCCNLWLGQVINREVKNQKKHVAESLIGEMLVVPTEVSLVANDCLINNCRKIYDMLPAPKEKTIKDRVGISRKSFTGFIKNSHSHIKLETILKLSLASNTTIGDLLTQNIVGEIEEFSLTSLNKIGKKKAASEILKMKNKVKHFFESCKKSNELIVFRQLKKVLGISYVSVEKYFPEIYLEMKELNVSIRKKNRDRIKVERFELIRKIVNEMHSSNQYPGLKKVMRELPFVITGFEKEYRDVWENSLKELGIKMKKN
nr:TniQ family protein [Metabacillus flavus]